MKKIISIIIVLAIVALGAYFYLTRPVAEPTENIQDQVTPVTVDDTTSDTVGGASTGDWKTYRIDSVSKVSFSIKEVLREKPFTAVGTTSQVAGEMKIKETGVATKQYTLALGEVKIDARTFKTDDEKRDGMIVRGILVSEKAGNEYITFTPADKTVTFENGKEFTLNGTLKVSSISKPVVLKITANVDGSKITGKMSATIKRSDYSLTIPDVPFVASVDDAFDISADISASQR